jgi:hypothetical protein
MIVPSSLALVRTALLAGALALWSGAALAQQPSAAALAIAKEIVLLKGASSILDPLVPGVVERVKFTLMQTSPMLQKPLEEVSALLRKQYANQVEQLHDNLAKIYASRFSEAELKQVLTFYKSPLGQKVMRQEPLIFEANMAQLNGWQEKFSTEVMARFRAEMRKRGHEL